MDFLLVVLCRLEPIIYFLTLKNSYKLRYELEEKIPDNDNVSHAGNTKLSHEYQEQIQFKDSINDQIFNKPQISR